MKIVEQTWIKALLKKMHVSMHIYKNTIIDAGDFEKWLILQNDLILAIQIVCTK